MKKIISTLILSGTFLSLFFSFTSCVLSNGSPKPKYIPVLVDDSDFENMDALQFTKVMGNGINLGNTMEAAGANWLGYDAEPTKYETAWGQPVTTKAIFEAMKEAGFDSVRIPVAWTSTMDWRNGDFEINDNFMERVKTLVDWALESGLIVMINDHWDYQWWGLFGQNKELAYKIFDAIWDDVGTTFKDYSYKLVFEAGNEEWGHRFNDEVDGKTGNLTENQQYKLMTELSQYFVDKIRAQGSNNTKRFLLIPGYNTDFVKTTNRLFQMPNDPINQVPKLLVSVHYYAPALYSLVGEPVDWGGIKQPAKTWGTTAEINEQNRLFSLLQNFKDDGIGVVIGEYAVAMLKNNDGTYTRKNNDVLWLKNVLDNCDKHNYAPFLWDCNNYFHKKGTLGFTDKDVAELFKNRRYELEK
ncbi:MAG: glycoside hydrolase family 5 protein [Treponema sp.]|nr:glycoside hydrolase family 5 protein [Treponema sp.]